jgi:hypothetical protein
MKVSNDALRLLDSCNDSDTCIESKLLPPDLLSADEDETSPKNARNEMAFHMFRPDDVDNNSFDKLIPVKGLSSCDDEGNTSVSSNGIFQPCGKQMQVSEFKVLDDEVDNTNFLMNKQSSPANKYSSIFSECLFA